jgi:hypothetical protein
MAACFFSCLLPVWNENSPKQKKQQQRQKGKNKADKGERRDSDRAQQAKRTKQDCPCTREKDTGGLCVYVYIWPSDTLTAIRHLRILRTQ